MFHFLLNDIVGFKRKINNTKDTEKYIAIKNNSMD